MLLMFVFTLVGCSSEDSEPNSAADLSSFGTEVSKIQCSKIFECCQADDLSEVFSGVEVSTQEECESAVDGYVRVFVVPGVEQAVDGGSATLGSSESACLSALQSQSCDAFSPSPNVDIFRIEACRDFIQPNLETSEFCSQDWECKSGFCAGEGSCATPPKETEPCASQRCAEGLFCNAENVCVRKVAEGEDCDRNEACASNNCVEQDTMRVCAPPARVCQ